MEKFKKQSYEEFTITADFVANFATGTTLTSQVVTAVDKNENNVSDVVLNQATVANNGESQVSVLVRAGDQLLSPYKITFRVIDSLFMRWELDIKMEVKEL